jgi:hypothetical protein
MGRPRPVERDDAAAIAVRALWTAAPARNPSAVEQFKKPMKTVSSRAAAGNVEPQSLVLVCRFCMYLLHKCYTRLI